VSYVILDHETRSGCDLKKCGAFVYSQHPTTSLICVGYSIDSAAPKLWKPGDEAPQDLFDAIAAGAWVVAHNVLFERAIWENILTPQWGWPAVPEEQWFDTMASCARRALPLDLDGACRLLGLEVQKDDEGKRALMKICKPVKKTGEFPEDPVLYERVYEYNKVDVLAEAGLLRRLRMLTQSEMDIFRLNQRMNFRGLGLDLRFAADCQAVVDGAMGPLEARFEALVGCRAGQRDRFLEWIDERYGGFPNLTKEVVEEALEDWPLPDEVRTALELRGAITSTSIKKLEAMRNCVGADSRARGLVQYHGAATGRDAGRLLQPQNFPRGEVEMGKDENGDEIPPWEVLVPALQTRDPEFVGSLFGCPIAAVSAALRHVIVPAPGKLLVAGDFSTIEARIVLALAGQHDRLALIRKGADLYCDLASTMLGRPINKKEHKKERQAIGKPTVLGCGFGMGAPKFHKRYMKKEPFALAQSCVDTYRYDWAPEVPRLWYGLEDAAVRTVWDRKPQSYNGCTYAIEDEWLTCRMPSGRKLYYFKPRPCKKAMPWDPNDIRPGWTYVAKKAGRVQTIDAYGGLLTENVVQALARDLLYDRALVADREGFPLVLTVHDEIVSETDEARADPKVLQQIMEDAPRWAIDLGVPVGAECWAGDRYRK